MKPRRVYVMLEIDTNASLGWMRKAISWRAMYDLARFPGVFKVIQAQANVAKPECVRVAIRTDPWSASKARKRIAARKRRAAKR